MTPEPGIYPGLTYDEYDAWDATRPTTVKRFAEHGCAEEVKWFLDGGERVTEAMLMGNAMHCRLLEPDKFADLYTVKPKTYENKKGEKKKWAGNAKICQEWIAKKEQAGFTILSPSPAWPRPMKQIEGMSEAIKRHPWTGPLLEGKMPEVSICWRDEPSGLLCKQRLDNVAGKVISDLKTCLDASDEGVMKSSYRLYYHIQASMAFDGWQAAGGEVQRYIFVFVQTKEPHLVNVVEAEEAVLQFGRSQYHYWLQQLKVCMDTGVWPGYAHLDVSTLLLPPWAGSEL